MDILIVHRTYSASVQRYIERTAIRFEPSRSPAYHANMSFTLTSADRNVSTFYFIFPGLEGSKLPFRSTQDLRPTL